jgi:intein-encoded DNA endonuclease-like protein
MNKIDIYKKVENYKEHQNKISRESVIKMYKSGSKQVEIAKYFKASKGTISYIIKNWKINQAGT